MINRLQTLSLPQRYFLFSGILIVFSYIYYIAAYLPQRARVLEAAEMVHAQKQEIRTAENFILRHPDPDSFLMELSKKKTQVDKLIPDDLAIADFLPLVDRSAGASGLHIAHIKPALPSNKIGYREISVEITAVGTFFQTIHFVKLLENSDRFCTIDTIGMKYRNGQLHSRISAIIYAYGIQPVTPKPR